MGDVTEVLILCSNWVIPIPRGSSYEQVGDDIISACLRDFGYRSNLREWYKNK